jgi:hypothetical protein
MRIIEKCVGVADAGKWLATPLKAGGLECFFSLAEANPPLKTLRPITGPTQWRFYLFPALLAISACTSTVTVTCPAPVSYTPGQQAEAADELLALPPGSILTQMMIDYGALRAKLRECQ